MIQSVLSEIGLGSVGGVFLGLQVGEDFEQTLHDFFVGVELSCGRVYAPCFLVARESQGGSTIVALDAEDGLRVETEQSAVEQVEGRPVERSAQSLIDDEHRLGVAELGEASGSAGGRGLTDQENV